MTAGVSISAMGKNAGVLLIAASCSLFSTTGCGTVPPDGPQEGEVFSAALPDSTTIAFVWIESGTFVMGSSEFEQGRFADESPQHTVTISEGFYIGKFEVTQGQWTAVMGTYPWRLRPPAQGPRDYVVEHPDHPAAYISWHLAQAFIEKMNETAGDSLYRLPTEAEWEYAARAGTITAWSFGNNESWMQDYGWYLNNAWVSDQEDEGEKYAHRVGTKLPNPWKLHDMHGNVCEWTQDWYSDTYYSISPPVDPTGPPSGRYRVLRGGAFNNDAARTRSARRSGLPPEFMGNGSIGLRLVRRAN